MHNLTMEAAEEQRRSWVRHFPALSDYYEHAGYGFRQAVISSILANDKLVIGFKLDLGIAVPATELQRLDPRSARRQVLKQLRELGFYGLEGMLIAIIHWEVIGGIVTFHLRGIATQAMAMHFEKITGENRLNWDAKIIGSRDIFENRSCNLPWVLRWLDFCTDFNGSSLLHWEIMLKANLYTRQSSVSFQKYREVIATWLSHQRIEELTVCYGTRLRVGKSYNYKLSRSNKYW